MFQRQHSILLLVTAVLLIGCRSAPAAFECTDAIGCVTVAPGEAIKLGVVQNLSGTSGPSGLSLMQCVELAVEDRGNELLDHPVELETGDSLCSGEGGTTAALKVAADPQRVGLLGPTCSGAAAPACRDRRR